MLPAQNFSYLFVEHSDIVSLEGPNRGNDIPELRVELFEGIFFYPLLLGRYHTLQKFA